MKLKSGETKEMCSRTKNIFSSGVNVFRIDQKLNEGYERIKANISGRLPFQKFLINLTAEIDR
ncbi:MAG: hypothetical protein KGZ42_01710 [Melioribacter sp.]|nr:hypothetical protein [Melioribacter sp.]